jgi:hypothetical protein
VVGVSLRCTVSNAAYSYKWKENGLYNLGSFGICDDVEVTG